MQIPCQHIQIDKSPAQYELCLINQKKAAIMALSNGLVIAHIARMVGRYQTPPLL